MEKKYVYLGAELPADSPMRKEVVMTARKKNIAWPPVWGEAVGETSEKYGLQSYICADVDENSVKHLQALIDAGCVTEKKRQVLRKKENGAGYEEVNLTVYYLMYKAKEALFEVPTAEEGVSDACNVETDATVEICLSIDDGKWKRYIYLEMRTAGPFSLSLVDYIQELEDTFEELPGRDGIRYEDGIYYITFFDEMGNAGDLEFCSLTELFRNIVSIRFVRMENKIIGRNGVEK